MTTYVRFHTMTIQIKTQMDDNPDGNNGDDGDTPSGMTVNDGCAEMIDGDRRWIPMVAIAIHQRDVGRWL